MHHKIATIINFCSNEYPFLAPCIQEVKQFSSQILVPVCDHFFDGKPEERAVLQGIYAAHPDVVFIEFPYNPHSLHASHSRFWHNLARLVGFFFTHSDIEYLLFLDCDEILDHRRFVSWLNTAIYRNYNALLIANYWYFRDVCHQAMTWEEIALLCKRQALHSDLIMQEKERRGIFKAVAKAKQQSVVGCDGKPMLHHYSWVRTKEQMLRKVSSWGHNKERDWHALVEKEFSDDFRGIDFVHEYTFTKVEPIHRIDLHTLPSPVEEGHFPNLHRLSQQQLQKIRLLLACS